MNSPVPIMHVFNEIVGFQKRNSIKMKSKFIIKILQNSYKTLEFQILCSTGIAHNGQFHLRTINDSRLLKIDNYCIV